MKRILFLKFIIPVFAIIFIAGTSQRKLTYQDNGLSIYEFNKIVNVKDTAVLVYFFADWCVPCVKLKPIMEELKQENPGTKIIKLDVDDHPRVSLHFEINTLPLFHIYKNGKQVWANNSFMNKNGLQAKITQYK